MIVDVTYFLAPFGCAWNPCLCAFWLIFGIPISLVVWIDAERRRQPGCLWAIIVIVIPVIGLLIYVVVVALGGGKHR